MSTAGLPFTQVIPAIAAGDTALGERAQGALLSLLEAFGSMILDHGMLHADPHAGNMLLQADGCLVLLDYGQCKVVSAERLVRTHSHTLCCVHTLKTIGCYDFHAVDLEERGGAGGVEGFHRPSIPGSILPYYQI